MQALTKFERALNTVAHQIQGVLNSYLNIQEDRKSVFETRSIHDIIVKLTEAMEADPSVRVSNLVTVISTVTKNSSQFLVEPQDDRPRSENFDFEILFTNCLEALGKFY